MKAREYYNSLSHTAVGTHAYCLHSIDISKVNRGKFAGGGGGGGGVFYFFVTVLTLLPLQETHSTPPLQQVAYLANFVRE